MSFLALCKSFWAIFVFLFFYLMPSVTNPIKGSNSSKLIFFTRTPTIQGLVLLDQGRWQWQVSPSNNTIEFIKVPPSLRSELLFSCYNVSLILPIKVHYEPIIFCHFHSNHDYVQFHNVINLYVFQVVKLLNNFFCLGSMFICLQQGCCVRCVL